MKTQKLTVVTSQHQKPHFPAAKSILSEKEGHLPNIAPINRNMIREPIKTLSASDAEERGTLHRNASTPGRRFKR